MFENLVKLEEKAEKSGKEFLYIGHYIDTQGRYILKIGTTNRLKGRQTEHTRNYKRAKEYTMPKNGSFIYDHVMLLSKYNTIRYEDKNRQLWQNMGFGEFVRNDRFCCQEKPAEVKITIKKEYTIKL